MRRIKEIKLSPALIVAVVALVAALGGGAVAGVAVNALNQKQIKKVREIAKKQDRKQLKKIRGIAGNKASQAVEGLEAGPEGQRGPEGPPGVRGPEGDIGVQGPPGPSTGPAGGDLAGEYPDPTIANEAVTASAVAPNTLGGDQIDETSLVGFLKPTGVGSFSGIPVGGGSGSSFGPMLLLFKRCTGSPGDVGFELGLENNSAFGRTVYSSGITDGGTAQVRKTFIASDDEQTIIDLPESQTSDLTHLVTIFVPNFNLTNRIFVRTKVNGGNTCAGEDFETSPSG